MRAEIVEFAYGDSQKWADFWAQKTGRANALWLTLFLLRSSLRGTRIFFIALGKFVLRPALAQAVGSRSWRARGSSRR